MLSPMDFDNGIKIQSGTEAFETSIASYATGELTVTFPEAFNTVPNVVASTKGVFTPQREISEPLVKAVNKTQVTFRVYNAYSGGALTPSISWIAVGT